MGYAAKVPTPMANVADDKNYKKFISRVYQKVGIGFTSSLTIVMSLNYLIPPEIMCTPTVMLSTVSTSLAVGLAGCYGIGKYEPMYRRYKVDNEEIVEAQDSTPRKISFYALVSATGVAMSVPMSLYLTVDPFLVPIAVGLSGGIFAGCSYLSTKISDASLLKWKLPLGVGLGSLLSIQLLNVGSYLCFGYTGLNAALSSIDIHAGLTLFTAMSIYDSYIARKMYKEGEPDVLLCATPLYLDFMNILQRVMAILFRNRN